MIRRLGLLTLSLLVFVASSLQAAKNCEIDLSTNASIVKSAKGCGFGIANMGIGKKVPPPKKVSIASFQIRFDFASQRYGTIIRNTYGTMDLSQRSVVQFEEDIYQEITDGMYEMFVATLEGLGYEVLPKEAVASSETYAMVEAGGAAKKKKSMIRASASGLKNIRGKGGAIGSIAAVNKLAGLNDELGADATISVFATMGLLQAAKKKQGLVVCLGSTSGAWTAGQEFEMLVLAGTKLVGRMPGGKPNYQAVAKAQVSMNPKKQLCYEGSVRDRTNSRWAWKAKYKTDLDGYIDSTVSLFGWASEIALLQLTAAAIK